MQASSYFIKVQSCRTALGTALTNNLEVVYCDETIFTRSTYHKSELAPVHHSYKVELKDIYIRAVWAVAFVSAERGLVHVATYTDEMDSTQFVKFTKQAWVKMGRAPFALFLDGAGFHRSN